jgi:hypothetical protein
MDQQPRRSPDVVEHCPVAIQVKGGEVLVEIGLQARTQSCRCHKGGGEQQDVQR